MRVKYPKPFSGVVLHIMKHLTNIELCASMLWEYQSTLPNVAMVKKEVLNFLIREYKRHPDPGYKEFLKSVFWYVVDNYGNDVDNDEQSSL